MVHPKADSGVEGGTGQIYMTAFSLFFIYPSCLLQGKRTMFMRWRALGPVQWLSTITKEVSLPSRLWGEALGAGWGSATGRWWLTPSAVVKRFRPGGLNVFLLESRMGPDLGKQKLHLSSVKSCAFSALSVLFDGGWMR